MVCHYISSKPYISIAFNGYKIFRKESFDKLAKYLETEKSIVSRKNVPRFELPSDREVVITRIFDAPRELVFKASTDPDLIPQWWGPKRFTTINEYTFNGVYREIVPPEREVHTFEFEGMPGHVILETSTFKEFEGKTKLTATDLFQSVEDRDGMFKSGMKEGATESMDRLEEIVLKEAATIKHHKEERRNVQYSTL